MKNHFTLIILCLLFLVTQSLQAQNACNGSRYIDDVFTDITKTTVQYGQNISVQGATQDLMMDIYTPNGDDPTIKRPVLIMAHGGSFVFGDRSLEEGRCRNYARKGFVTASIDYRLWPLLAGIPDSANIQGVVVMAVADMKAAVRYFKANAVGDDDYSIDPDLVFVGGLSAGAVTAVHTAYMQPEDENVPEFIATIIEDQGGIEGTSGNPGYSSEVAGVLNLSGGLYKTEWITADEVPMVSYHGNADGTVPYDFGLAAGIMSIHGSGLLHNRMEALNMTNLLHTVDGGGHTDIYEGGAMDQEWPAFLLESAGFLEDIICAATGAKDLVQAVPGMKVFPNPASNLATIAIDEPETSYDLFVYDQLGRSVYTAMGKTENQLTLEQSVLGTGVFFINAILENGQTVTGKLVFE